MRVSIQGGEYRVVLGRLCGDPSVTQEHDTCSSLLLDLLHRLTEQVTSRHLLYPLSGLIMILLQIAIEPLIFPLSRDCISYNKTSPSPDHHLSAGRREEYVRHGKVPAGRGRY